MKIKEIEKRYKDEWVLISCKDINENFEVNDGEVFIIPRIKMKYTPLLHKL